MAKSRGAMSDRASDSRYTAGVIPNVKARSCNVNIVQSIVSLYVIHITLLALAPFAVIQRWATCLRSQSCPSRSSSRANKSGECFSVIGDALSASALMHGPKFRRANAEMV